MTRKLWKAISASVLATITAAAADSPHPSFSSLPAANPKAYGYAPANQLAPGLRVIAVAQGSMPVENPTGIVGWYGYENDQPSPDNAALPQMVATPAVPLEAQKTEPDKNTYL